MVTQQIIKLTRYNMYFQLIKFFQEEKSTKTTQLRHRKLEETLDYQLIRCLHFKRRQFKDKI